MGNICGKESDAFSQPGRPLGTTPATPATAAVPASATKAAKVGGPPRRLGGESNAPEYADDARSRAAAAAEVR